MSATVTTEFAAQYRIQIRIVAPEVTSILLNGGTGPVSVDLPIVNAGALVATMAVVTRSSGAYTTPMRLEGADAAKFALTNGGVVPCNLVVGAANLVAGACNIEIIAP